jgi:hypothetical protein
MIVPERSHLYILPCAGRNKFKHSLRSTPATLMMDSIAEVPSVGRVRMPAAKKAGRMTWKKRMMISKIGFSVCCRSGNLSCDDNVVFRSLLLLLIFE